MSRDRSSPRRAPSRSGGFTLIELMVAVVLSGIVGIIVVQSFLSSRQTYRHQTNLEGVQSESRFALEFLTRTLRMSGYRGDSLTEYAEGPMTEAGGGTPALSGANDDADTTNGVKDGTDTVTVRFEGTSDGFVKDCLGATVAAGATSSNTFAISPGNQLECSTDGGASFTPIIDGVENMQILYGLDSDGDLNANRYVPASSVADFDKVVSLRVSLLFVSEDDYLVPDVDTKSYVLLDETVYGPGSPANDHRIRRQVTTTLRLRNRL